MAVVGLKVKLSMECLDGVREPIERNKRVQFTSNVCFVLTLLQHPEVPNKVFETRVEWVPPSPLHYKRVEPAILMKICYDNSTTANSTLPVPPALELVLEATPMLGVGWIEESKENFEWEMDVGAYAPLAHHHSSLL